MASDSDADEYDREEEGAKGDEASSPQKQTSDTHLFVAFHESIGSMYLLPSSSTPVLRWGVLPERDEPRV